MSQSFGYNDRNELTASTRSTTTWGYEYDNIGNRETSSETGDPTMTYIANALNQYHRTETADPKTGQGYRCDEDGNLIELYVAADMNP